MYTAVRCSGSAKFNCSSGKNEVLNAIQDESVVAVVRECDNQLPNTLIKTLSSILVRKIKPRSHNRSRSKRLCSEKLADRKSKFQCRSRNLFGHWGSKHNSGGSFAATVNSTKNPVFWDDRWSPYSSKQTIKLNMGNLSITLRDMYLSTFNLTDILHGALLDDAASYAVIGMLEMEVVARDLLPQ